MLGFDDGRHVLVKVFVEAAKESENNCVVRNFMVNVSKTIGVGVELLRVRRNRHVTLNQVTELSFQC